MGHLSRLLNAGAVFAEPLDDLARLRARYDVTGAPTMSPSPFGHALTLDGAADYVTLGEQEEYALRFDAGTQDFSVACWIFRDSVGLDHQIISKRDALDDGWGFRINTDDRLWFDLNADLTFSGSDIVGAGDWLHVAVTVDRSVEATVYLGGQDVSVVQQALIGQAMATTVSPTIGCRSYDNGQLLGGMLRNLKVFDRILTLAEIVDLAGLRAFDY